MKIEAPRARMNESLPHRNRLDQGLLRQCNFETLHSELAAKMHFAYSSFARTRLPPSSVRAFSK